MINLTGKGDKYDYFWNLYHGMEWEANISLLDLGSVNSRTMELVIHSDVQMKPGELEKSHVGLISTSLRSDGSKVISFNCNSLKEIEQMTVWLRLEKMVHASLYLDFPHQSHKPNQHPIQRLTIKGSWIYSRLDFSTFFRHLRFFDIPKT